MENNMFINPIEPISEFTVTLTLKSGIVIKVPIVIDYDEQDTEDFNETVIQDAMMHLDNALAEASQEMPINWHNLTTSIDVDNGFC
jgi:hypothetical protein